MGIHVDCLLSFVSTTEQIERGSINPSTPWCRAVVYFIRFISDIHHSTHDLSVTLTNTSTTCTRAGKEPGTKLPAASPRSSVSSTGSVGRNYSYTGRCLDDHPLQICSGAAAPRESSTPTVAIATSSGKCWPYYSFANTDKYDELNYGNGICA